MIPNRFDIDSNFESSFANQGHRFYQREWKFGTIVRTIGAILEVMAKILSAVNDLSRNTASLDHDTISLVALCMSAIGKDDDAAEDVVRTFNPNALNRHMQVFLFFGLELLFM
ncbi:uncharacterized protein J3R85_002079 [Psidium guajava]|nr:uncharacterized protein J3R85_002079 [Psidium guajava]